MGFASRGIASADIAAAVIPSIDPDATYIDVWSNVPIVLTCTAGANTTRAMSSVAVPNLAGRAIVYALAMIDVIEVYDSSGAINYWNRAASAIQVDKAAAGWLTAITTPIPGAGLKVGANLGRPGFRMVGAVDITAKVAFNATTDFQWFETRAFGNNLVLFVQSGVRIFLKNP